MRPYRLLFPILMTALPAYADEPVTALVGATVHPVADPDVPGGVILIQGRRILAVGKDVAVPAGAVTVDLKGLHVYPGLIDSMTRLGLVEIGSVDMTNDADEATGASTPQVRTIDAFNPESQLLPVARVNGITTALSAPGEGNVFAGQSALMHLDGRRAADMIVKSPAALHVNFGEPPKARYGEKNQMPRTRMGTAALIREQFVKAQEYAQKLEQHEKKKKEYEEKTAKGEKSSEPEPPARDLKLEVLVRALRGELPVVARAHRTDDILTAIRLAEEFKLRLILSHATEGYKVAGMLAEKKIPVLVGPIDTQPEAMETLGAIYENAKLLHEAGVKIAIQSDDDHNVRNLPYQAGLAAAYGLPVDAALRAITAAPAEIFGVADQVGSIRPGLYADLLVTDGDPMQPRSSVKKLYIAGRDVPLISRHTEIYDKFR